MFWLSAIVASLIAANAIAQGNGAPTSQAATAPPGNAITTPRTPAPHDAYVYIGWPEDGATVGTKFKVWFGTRDFGIAPAGVTTKNTGHHHLLIDVPVPPLDQPIPNDRNHLHFGLGQTETMVELPPGKHTLQLLMGDADHVPHDPALMSRRITVYVRATAPTTQ
jgi:hypothetical protein